MYIRGKDVKYVERSSANVLRDRFGVQTLRVFGSVARGEQNAMSDVDVCVEMPPHLYRFVELGQFLEDLLGCPVDVVRMHRHMNVFLREEIEKDGVYVL